MGFDREVMDFDVKHVRCVNEDVLALRTCEVLEGRAFLALWGGDLRYVEPFLDVDIFL